MKLLYLWVENHYNMIKNQSFNISSSYHIDFDIEFNVLNVSKNRDYIDNFYGNNILDITAIVGRNGVGKTTITRFLYDKCDSVHPCDENKEYVSIDTKRILVYERGSNQKGERSKLIIHYYLSDEPIINNPEGIEIELIDLKTVQKEEFIKAEQEHDITTVYFTNAFEISNVMNNQGLSEFSSWGVHKSLCYTPMLSLQKAFTKLKSHYGADKADGGFILLDVINQYAQNMTTDFKTPYATSISYNFLIAVRYFPNSIAKLLPIMKDFKLNITEFGEYIKFQEDFFRQSQFNQTVMFIRKNIYEFLADKFKKDHWQQMYLNILCEIVLCLINMFTSRYKNVNFEVLEKDHIRINSEEAFEKILGQIANNDENAPKKELIRRIRNVQGVDLNVIRGFIDLQDGNMQALRESRWYRQVQNFLDDYNIIANIEIAQTINFGFMQLIELIIDHYNNKETVYGRMLSIIPQPMSSGEAAMINLFATVYSALKKKTSGSILLIIDEIDAFLHPKWQQDILTHITRWINESKEFNKKKVQLVIATHSPIILSDIPKDNIIYLQKSFETTSKDKFTFGANISTLFYDSFFMEQGSIGAIARKQIQWAIDNIRNTNLGIEDRKKLVYIIDNIGDKFLREKLKSYSIYIAAKDEGRDSKW
ncbi:AAA ATPase [Clostridium sp. DL-VIII]|uniref:AAA family ATPase n=1 Tax=Clostridium sp. DL-VIII TaxID=641107 RepID=UPI00023B037B|nr:AAA family ATPase [Clostridium sp. DL-VIII]EHJ02365.1 AAA ATPase [Clostridium sp. DL-VIII]